MEHKFPDEVARTEWLAWRLVCVLLKDRGIDVNAPDAEDLVRAMRYWGEAYLTLFDGTGEHTWSADRDAEVARALMATRALL